MIISASYKTDIPAFYGKWFMNRLDAGYCRMVNPYNRAQISTISLARDDVDGFVFWTKNLGPFMENLAEIKRRGYPFIVQYAINGYPRALEHSVASHERSIEYIRRLHDSYGEKVGVWRYDPIVISSLTPPDFHRKNFEALAEKIQGATDEVVVSFAQIYKKTRRNMDWAANEYQFSWSDPEDNVKIALLKDLAAIASANGLQLKICAQPQYLIAGIQSAHCTDAPRLAMVAGHHFKTSIKGNRTGCMCYMSKDIGDYDTCPHGCVYCYAVANRQHAKRRYQQHDPDGEFLFPVNVPPLGKEDFIDEEGSDQPDLFDGV